ncbi:MAG TPA: type III-A CRISPR-associated protein Cas10/Csm1 [Chitinophagales bacterium]|nr:type III-A CRISPR-associated protein Cas10/Csm1 [Chitinophagales bacterium]
MNTERHKIYLAALLHDIGKFAYRAQETRAGEGHEPLGEKFILEHLNKIKVTQDCADEIKEYSKHHETASYCRIADQITAAERIDEKDSKEARRPLVCIFQNIFREIRNGNGYPAYYKPDGIYYYEPTAIDVQNIKHKTEKNISDSAQWKFDNNESIRLHKASYDDFKKELASLNNTGHIEAFVHSLYYLLHKYTARISSASYKSYPDISLFDHSRTTAALVNCLTYILNEKDLKEYNPEKSHQDFLLLKGDLAGIQKFIYSDISPDIAGDTKGLAKRLRGRSFYVALLTDFIASLFICKLELAEANILYSGGGHFLLIAPSNEEVEKKIDALEKEINLMLRDKLSSRLTLVTGRSSFGNNLFSNASEAIQKVNYELNRNKYKKYSNYLDEIINFRSGKTSFKDDEKLGKNLPYGKYLLEIVTENPGELLNENSLVASFEKFHTYYFIIKEPEKGNEKDAIKNLLSGKEKTIQSVRIFKINDAGFLEFAKDLCGQYDFPISFGFKFVGIAAPKDEEGDVLSFEEIAGLDRTPRGKLSYPQLGILRLDVDNLGAIFALGLEEHGTSFSRIAALSRELHHFFCGYINTVAEKHQIYIAYSGGDDAFFIGSWINIIHFAKEFRDTFKEFTCNNPNITFSAGIFLCDSHFPVAKFAENAKEAENRSKNFNNKSKNAITVFEHTPGWENYDSMLMFSEKLLRHTKTKEGETDNKLARSLVHRLLRIIKASLYSKGKYQGEVDIDKLNRNVMQLHYLFARHGFTHEEIEKAQDELKKDIIKVIMSHFSKKELVKNYLIPTHYVVLKTRTLEKN